MSNRVGIISFTRNQFVKKLNALTVAIYLSCQGVNLMLQAIIPAFSSLSLPGIFAICFVLMLFGIRKIQRKAIVYLLPILFLLYFVFTNLIFPGKSAVNIIQLLTYSILPFIIVQLEFDIKDVVKCTLIIMSPTILVAGKVFAHTYNGGIPMGTSYAFMPAVICAIMYVICYAKNETNNIARYIYLALCLICVYFFYQILFYGSRGPIVCILCFIVLFIFFRRNSNTGEVESRRLILFTIIIIALFVILAFGDSIVAWVTTMLSSDSVNIRAVSKSYLLSQEEVGILNGRDAIYSTAFQGVLQSPLFGNGMDMFYVNTGYTYPHNFFLQLLYDGGLLLACPVVILVVVYSIRILRTRNYVKFMEWSMLFCISVPGALFSGDLWEKYTLWFFFAYCIVRGSSIYESEILKEKMRTQKKKEEKLSSLNISNIGANNVTTEKK